jgi:hypothetical protein
VLIGFGYAPNARRESFREIAKRLRIEGILGLFAVKYFPSTGA